MSTLELAWRGQASRYDPVRVFDWNKAARRLIDEKGRLVQAALEEDWEWTCGIILKDGKIPEERDTYLASTWATPILVIDGSSEPCWVWQKEHPDWDATTFWPPSARKILSDS